MHRVFTAILFCGLGEQALAQASSAPAGGDSSWLSLVVAVLALAGGIWWYMTRIRGASNNECAGMSPAQEHCVAALRNTIARDPSRP
jgi:hypothetical protein